MLALHIAIAVLSMAFTTFLYFSPSRTKGVRELFAGGTHARNRHVLGGEHCAPLLKACVTGLAYLGAVTAGIMLAQRKLALQEQRHDRHI